MEKDVTVLVWGEFGRTPVISPVAGRDHWPRVSAAVLAGGGMKTGQVIGATDRLAGEATARPVKFAEVFATLYHNLGIDTRTATITDLNGRPQYLVADHAQPLAELVGYNGDTKNSPSSGPKHIGWIKGSNTLPPIWK